jgi:hypothetical protein
MLSRHLRSTLEFVDQASQEIGVQVGPVLIQNHIKMRPSSMVILSLHKKSSQEDPHLSGESSALTLDLLVEALFCLDLKSISETELSIFAPFCGIARIISQVIHEVLLRIFHVTYGVKLMSKSVKLLLVGLSEALID